MPLMGVYFFNKSNGCNTADHASARWTQHCCHGLTWDRLRSWFKLADSTFDILLYAGADWRYIAPKWQEHGSMQPVVRDTSGIFCVTRPQKGKYSRTSTVQQWRAFITPSTANSR